MRAVLDHVGVAVADLDASLAFFRDATGPPRRGSRRCRVAGCARAVGVDGPHVSRAASVDSARFADCEVSRKTRPRAPPHHATGRRHPKGVGRIAGPRGAAHRRAGRGPAPRGPASRLSIRRAPRACSSS
jgi:catechol 2,3-dioxygenase-like lactoylglutathione lyase family enzyme